MHYFHYRKYSYLSALFIQSLQLHDEVTHQKKYVDDLEEKFVDTKGSLKQEITRIVDVRKASQGLCWMYGVIAAEVVLLFFLLYVGLS